MKRIGIIGGAGPLASALLYRKLVEEAYALGFEVEAYLVNYPFKRDRLSNLSLLKQLQNCFEILKSLKVDIAAVCCNTLHAYLPEIELDSIEIVHLPKVATQSIEKESTLILGTRDTVEKELYGKYRAPEEEIQSFVEAVIDRILLGNLQQKDSEKLRAIIYKSKAPQVVLGCTELSVLHDSYPIQVPGVQLVNSVSIAAKELARRAA